MIKEATLASGCFWCTETLFSRMQGVISSMPGYSGGSVKNPAYREVCNGTTGHAECVHLKFDDDIISFHDYLFCLARKICKDTDNDEVKWIPRI